MGTAAHLRLVHCGLVLYRGHHQRDIVLRHADVRAPLCVGLHLVLNVVLHELYGRDRLSNPIRGDLDDLRGFEMAALHTQFAAQCLYICYYRVNFFRLLGRSVHLHVVAEL